LGLEVGLGVISWTGTAYTSEQYSFATNHKNKMRRNLIVYLMIFFERSCGRERIRSKWENLCL